MLKQAGQRISDTLKHELGGKNKPKNNRQEQTRVLAQGCFRPDSNMLTIVQSFLCSGKATGSCTFFANKQDCTTGRTKFGINSSFHYRSLLLPPNLENQGAIQLKRRAQHKRIKGQLKRATCTFSSLTIKAWLCFPNLFGLLLRSVKWKYHCRRE